MLDTLGVLKKILLKFFELFLKKGGKFNKTDIQDIQFTDEKPVLKNDTQKFTFDKVVIACGAFSKKLTDKLDEKIPWILREDTMFTLKIVIIFYQDQ